MRLKRRSAGFLLRSVAARTAAKLSYKKPPS
jgi:hypothetical protein